MTMAFVSGMDAERKRVVISVLVALALEALVLGGGYRLLRDEAPHTLPKPQPKPLTVVMLQAPAVLPVPAPVPAPSPPTPPKAAPKRVTKVPPPKPKPMPTPPKPKPKPKPILAPPPAVAAPAATTAAPTLPAVQAAPAAAPAKAAPTPAAEPTPAQKATFEGRLRAAIQSALQYPESARMGGMTGQTKVAFTFRDGQVSDISVVTSSGMSLLDRAAVAAVRNAHYPLPDAVQAGKTLREQLWVTFTLDDSE